MNNNSREMIKKYNMDTRINKKNAIKEVIQEIVLCGLSRGGFFNVAAFYGGTALRIFYGLDRFSEDLDFSLIEKDKEFDLSNYFSELEKEIRSFGLQMKIESKKKSQNSNIQSAFLKGDTKKHIVLFYEESDILENIGKNELIKIKFEVDINPPLYANFEKKYKLLPTPYEVNMYDISSLFAGKIHAILFRKWKNRIKGRDLYDYIFYLSHNTKYNHKHLCERIMQSGVENARELSAENIKQMLYARFDEIDYKNAKEDVKPFISDVKVLDLWSSDFFKSITVNLSPE